MKTLNFLEIQSIVEMLNDELSNSHLQDVQCVDDKLSFCFYRDRQTKWLVLDLDGFFPFLGLFPDAFRAGPKAVKPVILFVRAHFMGRRLLRVRVLSEKERIVMLDFQDGGELEFRCIPKQTNFLIRDHGKTISWDKVRELPTKTGQVEAPRSEPEFEVRSIPVLMNLWKSLNGGLPKSGAALGQNTAVSPYDRWKADRLKQISKKEGALLKLREQAQNPMIGVYQKMGEHLKIYGYKNLELDWPKYLDLTKRVSENIELCFAKIKQLKSKSVGAAQRIEQLAREIEDLKDTSLEAFETKTQSENKKLQQPTSSKLKHKVEVRKKVLDSENDIVAYMGKSAQENVKLLRQAQPWHLWFHLKDYPGSYVIMFFNKTAKISDTLLRDASTWLVEEAFRSKSQMSGVKVVVVYTQCRYLKLLKGDRLGRVTYTNAKELVISI